jgi:hypothetical protein
VLTGAFRAFALAVLLAWLLPAHSEPPLPTPSEASKPQEQKTAARQQSAAEDNRGTAQAPFVVNVLPPVKTEQEAEQDAKERDEKSSSDRWLAIGALLTAIFTGLLVFVTSGLAYYTYQLWAATRDMARKLDETTKRQLRAYVSTKGLTAGTNSINGAIREYIIFADFENVGVTPATDVKSWIYIKQSPAGQADNLRFQPIDRATPMVLGRGATARTGYQQITIEDMRKRWRNEIDILVWVRIEYRDVFDPESLRYSEICCKIDLIHDPSTNPPKDHPSYVQFSIFGPQNSAA